MLIKGKLIAESPIYRGNARKTLFTRDGDGRQRMVSLSGEISGTAQALMDAFIGKSRNGKNIGLINELWQRLYGSELPENLIRRVDCKLNKSSYPKDNFFDLRMGIRLNDDRGAAEANANYKMETIFRNAAFDFSMDINDSMVRKGDYLGKLFYVIEELKSGRFWFGAGKTKGLGRCTLQLSTDLPKPLKKPQIKTLANHMTMGIDINASNPLLIGWNWGKIDPNVPAFAAIEGKVLLEGLRELPEPISKRLNISIGGPISSADDWKEKFKQFLPKAIVAFLSEQGATEKTFWIFPKTQITKLGKGKYPLQKKILNKVKKLGDVQFSTKEDAEKAFNDELGKDAKKAKRTLDILEKCSASSQDLDINTWKLIANPLGFDDNLFQEIAPLIKDDVALLKKIEKSLGNRYPQLFQQIDRQIKLIQSDAWIDLEISIREEHIMIKEMIGEGKITEWDWNDANTPPKGIKSATWKEFMVAHSRVRYKHMTNRNNLAKSIQNDKNVIAFLNGYRNRTRQELSQPNLTDFRGGGPSGRVISQQFGKPYDTVFMRMLTWKQSENKEGWEIYIPGSTIKGAFRKRASQILRTLWGEEAPKTRYVLERIFGAQGKRGLLLFSDAYLKDPNTPDQVWCSMDGVRMNPTTGKPIEEAKCDYLFAYGQQLLFNMRVDIMDIVEKDQEVLSVLTYLFRDFQEGEISIGGEKTNGFGWVNANLNTVYWQTAQPSELVSKWLNLVLPKEMETDGPWQKATVNQEKIADALTPVIPLKADIKATPPPPVNKEGYISHRSFGGHCGILYLEAKVLTALAIKESGEPSFTQQIDAEPVNGWEFFSMAPPKTKLRDSSKKYAIPSKTLKGMIRHIYTIASDSVGTSANIGTLNDADCLFGWVGHGPNQALMGRLSFDFAFFQDPKLTWYKVPYPYGKWEYINQEWKESSSKKSVTPKKIKDWRIFTHAPLAPCVTQLDEFVPDTVQASYNRAIQPGSTCSFGLRFWNLETEELQRLIWCLVLEDGLAHKCGNAKHLGLGSIQLKLLPESYTIKWDSRYTNDNWKEPVEMSNWLKTDCIKNYNALKDALDAKCI
jgi:CRISPR/Cas system CSM-associated protein Csm3 (group 7 of RAMP superfamily)